MLSRFTGVVTSPTMKGAGGRVDAKPGLGGATELLLVGLWTCTGAFLTGLRWWAGVVAHAAVGVVRLEVDTEELPVFAACVGVGGAYACALVTALLGATGIVAGAAVCRICVGVDAGGGTSGGPGCTGGQFATATFADLVGLAWLLATPAVFGVCVGVDASFCVALWACFGVLAAGGDTGSLLTELVRGACFGALAAVGVVVLGVDATLCALELVFAKFSAVGALA